MQIGQFLLLLMYVLLCLLLLGLGLLVVVGHECQLGLALHAGVDDLRELFLVLLLDAVDILPGVVFDLLALFFVLGHEFLAGFAQRGGLSLLLLELQGVLGFEVLQDFFVGDEEVVETLLEFLGLFLLLVVELLVTLVICLLLVGIVLLSTG